MGSYGSLSGGGEDRELLERKAREQGRCRACRGLYECQYANMGNVGFEPIWSEWSPRYEVVKECSYKVARGEQAKAERLFIASRIPLEHRRKRLREIIEGGRVDGAVEALVDHALGESKWVYLQGPSGSGKTELASATGNTMIGQGGNVIYVTVPELLTELRYQNEGYYRSLREVSEAKALIMEDLGSERMSEYNQEQLELVLDRRLREGRRTLITSTYRVGELRYSSERLRNRLQRFRRAYIAPRHSND